MENSSKILALLFISMLAVSTATTTIKPDCAKPKPKPKPKPHPPKTPTLPPIVKPPITLPPVTVPPIVKPPVTLPPVTVPPITLPPVVNPPVVLPPVVVVPPVLTPPTTTPCPPPPSPAKPATCPIDSLKLGACVDLLGGLVHIGLGDPAANECCPILGGLLEAEAAVCLCTTLKIKALNLQIYVPIALQLLLTCGKTPPPGYACSL
ncbi:uncharacterized protein [Primulina huaijiensis]|uniref:uncharacterized protein n=1 Tax=Primulina huaijiensis TaxID=1492673 RepID=UPI003CC6DF23